MSKFNLDGFIRVSKECFIENVIGFNSVERFEDDVIMRAIYSTHTCQLVSIKSKRNDNVLFYLKTI